MKGKKTSFLAQQINGTKMLGDTCNACKNWPKVEPKIADNVRFFKKLSN